MWVTVEHRHGPIGLWWQRQQVVRVGWYGFETNMAILRASGCGQGDSLVTTPARNLGEWRWYCRQEDQVLEQLDWGFD